MTLYLDSSALVKRYIAEPGSTETRAIIAAAPLVGTAVITALQRHPAHPLAPAATFRRPPGGPSAEGRTAPDPR